MDHTNDNNNTFLNWCLSICVGLFAYIESLTFDEMYNYLFKTLTIISVTLIVIINLPKAWAVIKSIFKS